ncbi:MAG: sensor histidine kinase, partial [Pseudobdellovibrionaceae bacterium]
MSVRKNIRYFVYLAMTAVFGIALTIFIFQLALNKEKEEFRSQFASKADSIGFSLDLMIAHNTLRLQNFEENLSLDLKANSQNFILATLNSSVFSVFSHYKMIHREGADFPVFERLLRIDAKKEGHSQNPVPISSDITSLNLKEEILKMNSSKDKFISMFVEQDGRIYFFLVMRSLSQKDHFYLFSGNVTDLLSSYVQISRQSQVILHQTRDDSYWLISHVDPKVRETQIQKVSADEQELFIRKSEIRRDYAEKFIGDTFDIIVFSDFTTRPDHFWPLIVLGAGILITGLISLLLYSLINRNIDVENQVHVKTIDLEIQTEKAIEASASKTRFLANISHEIRTPLNIVLGMTDLLQETRLTQQQNKFLNSLRTSGQHLLALIEDILDMARIDSNDVNFKETTVNLMELFEDVCRIVGPNVARKKLKLYVDLDVNLPQTVSADPARLRQICINLINNSVKFTESGSISIILKKWDNTDLHSNLGPFYLDLSVSDTGIGIPVKNQEDVFKAFYQVNPAMTRQKGGV